MRNVFFDWSVPFRNMPSYLQALGVTLLITLIVCLCETVIGALFGYIRYTKKPKLLFGIVTAYVEFIRNTPLLVQIFFIFYGLPVLGLSLKPIQAGIISLIICHSAYVTEVFRSGIQSIGLGQWEAASCLGLSKIRSFLDVIFPQALRTIFPTLSNQYIMTLLSTSLLAALNINEITNVTQTLSTKTFRVFENYTVAIILYYILNILVSFSLKYINRKCFPSVSSKGE